MRKSCHAGMYKALLEWKLGLYVNRKISDGKSSDQMRSPLIALDSCKFRKNESLTGEDA